MNNGGEPDYRLQADEPLGVGVRRIVSEQIELARRRLGTAGAADFAESVHESRKAFKRVRAVVRLLRDEIGDDVYRRENQAFRDAGRRLSEVRDATVLLETLDALAAREDEDVHGRPFERLRAQLAADRDVAHERVRSSDAAREVISALDDAAARLVTLPLPEGASHETLAPGLGRIYRRGRRALRAARDDPADENFHERASARRISGTPRRSRGRPRRRR